MTKNSQLKPELKCYDSSAQWCLTQQVSGDGTFRLYTKIFKILMPYLPLIHKCINLRTPMCIYQFCPSCFGVCFTMSMSFFLMSFRYFNFFSEHIWISNTCQFVVEFLNVSRHDCLFLLANKDYFLLESLI